MIKARIPHIERGKSRLGPGVATLTPRTLYVGAHTVKLVRKVSHLRKRNHSLPLTVAATRVWIEKRSGKLRLVMGDLEVDPMRKTQRRARRADEKSGVPGAATN